MTKLVPWWSGADGLVWSVRDGFACRTGGSWAGADPSAPGLQHGGLRGQTPGTRQPGRSDCNTSRGFTGGPRAGAPGDTGAGTKGVFQVSGGGNRPQTCEVPHSLPGNHGHGQQCPAIHSRLAVQLRATRSGLSPSRRSASRRCFLCTLLARADPSPERVLLQETRPSRRAGPGWGRGWCPGQGAQLQGCWPPPQAHSPLA